MQLATFLFTGWSSALTPGCQSISYDMALDISRSHVYVFQYPSIDPSLCELKDPFIIAMNKFLSTHSLYYFPYLGDNTPEELDERKLRPSFSSRSNTLWLCRYVGKPCSWLCQESIGLWLILHLSPVSREMNEAKNGVITSKVCLQNCHFLQWHLSKCQNLQIRTNI